MLTTKSLLKTRRSENDKQREKQKATQTKRIRTKGKANSTIFPRDSGGPRLGPAAPGAPCELKSEAEWTGGGLPLIGSCPLPAGPDGAPLLPVPWSGGCGDPGSSTDMEGPA